MKTLMTLLLLLTVIGTLSAERIVLFFDDFENGSGNWTFVNGAAVNKWHIGNATSFEGSNALYISNDNGVSNAYNVNSYSFVHAYTDILLPRHAGDIRVNFSFKGMGEYGFDVFDVYIVPEDFIPEASNGWETQYISSSYLIGEYICEQPEWTTYTLDGHEWIYTHEDTTYRFLFVWKNDNSIGVQPPAAIDNVEVSYVPRIANPPRNLTATADSYTINLTWDEPLPGSTETFVDYSIYRDGLYYDMWITTTSYTDIVDENRVYSYYVVANYEISMFNSIPSEPSNTVYISPNIPLIFNPPQNLIGNANGNVVTLSWEEPESGSSGDFVGYMVYKDEEPLIEESISELYFIDTVTENGTYIYKVLAIYENGESEPATVEVTVSDVSETDDNAIGFRTILHSNYPNPFNPETTISFSVAVESHVSIVIFNIRGQKARTLVNSNHSAGNHSVVWNGKDENGQDVGSGIYFYQMQTNDYVTTRKMVLMK
ncbi:MAG: T9SS type A sorting domain-containing protein [Candidatus Cloacimonetes bacterium]|nr:T9SS type A sorting domain-containing protein [Candidatus Cloacimonadota bacterium]